MYPKMLLLFIFFASYTVSCLDTRLTINPEGDQDDRPSEEQNEIEHIKDLIDDMVVKEEKKDCLKLLNFVIGKECDSYKNREIRKFAIIALKCMSQQGIGYSSHCDEKVPSECDKVLTKTEQFGITKRGFKFICPSLNNKLSVDVKKLANESLVIYCLEFAKFLHEEIISFRAYEKGLKTQNNLSNRMANVEALMNSSSLSREFDAFVSGNTTLFDAIAEKYFSSAVFYPSVGSYLVFLSFFSSMNGKKGKIILATIAVMLIEFFAARRLSLSEAYWVSFCGSVLSLLLKLLLTGYNSYIIYCAFFHKEPDMMEKIKEKIKKWSTTLEEFDKNRKSNEQNKKVSENSANSSAEIKKIA